MCIYDCISFNLMLMAYGDEGSSHTYYSVTKKYSTDAYEPRSGIKKRTIIICEVDYM